MREQIKRKDKKIEGQLETIKVIENQFQRRIEYLYKENQSLYDQLQHKENYELLRKRQ